MSAFLLVIGEFLVSFCLPVLFTVGLVARGVLEVGGGGVFEANIELNFCNILCGNLLFTGSFCGGESGGWLLLGLTTINSLGGGGDFSADLGGGGWITLGVTGVTGGGGWLDGTGLLLLGVVLVTVG